MITALILGSANSSVRLVYPIISGKVDKQSYKRFGLLSHRPEFGRFQVNKFVELANEKSKGNKTNR